MTQNPIVFTFFIVFTGAAVLATLALAARQSLLVAYIGLGILFGPWGLDLVADAGVVAESAKVGIVFLLFLLGLDLTPQDLASSLRRTTLVTVGSAVILLLCGGTIALLAGFTPLESLIVGAALGFSSTIIGLKLLPTTVLHHQRMGEVIISILLLQDLLAIALLLLLEGAATGAAPWLRMGLLLLSLPGLVIFAGLAARYVLIPLIRRYDTFREYIFLVTVGWCLGMAELAGLLGLSHEIGAFIAGVAMASSPIALYIADRLRPLRDFFLVLFFFGVGVEFNLTMAADVVAPALLLAAVALALKPAIFRLLLARTGEPPARAWEIGFRLGQMSEFSLLIASLALATGTLSARAAYSLQLATVLTFLVSSYLVVLRYPTPIAISATLRRD
jgi:Kef-type K+ transport system membrane component KefB